MNMNNFGSNKIKGVIEAILFASGDAVSAEKLAVVLQSDKDTVKQIINDMILEYSSSSERGIIIREINGEYQFSSKPELSDYIREFWSLGQTQVLSQPAYEVLSIVAYEQPVTRARIEKIRGVNSDSSVAKLVERGLIAEAGRQDVPGRPLLYATTDEFLRCFGFRSLKDLPELKPDSDLIEMQVDTMDEQINVDIVDEQAGVITADEQVNTDTVDAQVDMDTVDAQVSPDILMAEVPLG